MSDIGRTPVIAPEQTPAQYPASTESLALGFDALRQRAQVIAAQDPMNAPHLDLGVENVTAGIHLATALSEAIQQHHIPKIHDARARDAASKAARPGSIHPHLRSLVEKLRARAEEDEQTPAGQALLGHIAAFDRYLELETESRGFLGRLIPAIGSRYLATKAKSRGAGTGKRDLTQRLLDEYIFKER